MVKKTTEPTPAPDEKAAPKGAATATDEQAADAQPKVAKAPQPAPAAAQASLKRIPENVSEAEWINSGGQYVVAQRYFRDADQTWVEEGAKYAISTRDRVNRMLAKGLIKRDPAMIQRLAPEGGKPPK